MTTRRSFLGRAAAPAVVYKFVKGAPALYAAAADLRFGFIGVGIRGMFLLEEFQKIGVKPVIAADVYDGHLTRAKEVTKGTIATTRDYRTVLDHKDIDAVVIATPDHWHKQMMLDALAAGKHVYLEKPMAWSIEQCLEIARAVEASKQKVQIGSGAGNSPISEKAREIVASGALGQVNHVRMENNRNNLEGAWVYAVPPDASPQTIDWQRFVGPSPQRDFDANIFFRWRCWWEYSGGVATDLYVHMLTQLHCVMRVEVARSVVAQGGIFRWKDGRTVPDFMSSLYEYPGFLASLSVNLGNAQAGRSMTIYGSKGTLLVGGRNTLVHTEEAVDRDVQRYGTNAWPAAMRQAYFAAKGNAVRPVPAKPKEIVVTSGPSHQAAFVQSLGEGQPLRETAWEGHCAAGSAHLANVAYRSGRRMSWDAKTGEIREG